MTEIQEKLTHSRLSCFRQCPRKHLIRYEWGIRPEETGLALRVGSAFHAALEAADKGEDIDGAMEASVSDPYDLALVAAMYDGHARRWESDPLELVASEMEFDLPLINPDTGRPSTIFRLAGKMDRLVKLRDGRIALMEYKSTSRDFSPESDYWMRLHMDQQLSIYVIAARQLGYEVETVLYDVTKRPMLRPLKATPVEKRQYVQKTGGLYANQRDMDETPSEFAGRVAADIAAKTDQYFARIEIARLDQDLDECRAELWQQQQALRESQRSGRWYRNPGACFENHWACDYLSICLNRDLETRTPQGFVRLTDVHPELGQEIDV